MVKPLNLKKQPSVINADSRGPTRKDVNVQRWARLVNNAMVRILLRLYVTLNHQVLIRINGQPIQLLLVRGMAASFTEDAPTITV